MPRHSLKLLELSDRELLHAMLDLADEEGYASVFDLAEEFNIDHKHARQCVAQRLSWLKRYGAVERLDGEPRWRPTSKGLAIARGSLSPEQREALDGLSSEQMLEATRLVTGRYRRIGDTAAHLMRREWTYGTYGRKFR